MKVTLIPKGAVIKKEEVSAVFLIGFIGDKIVVTRNERGWDMPGGHLNEGEELLDGLRRETEEEAGVSFVDTIPYAKLFLPNKDEYKDKYMVSFVSNSCKLGDFTPKPDAFERDLLDVKTFIECYYHGDKDALRDLIQKAQESLKLI
ncbi:MAG: NUDIX domain-containing protein [Candidatus Staskawiczbacteria bacterium]|nr:NUDIX domain-containing protein [Candidatus Staskawiczbacteria bacterium]